MEKVMWLVLGATTMVGAVRAGRSPRAYTVACLALGTLFLVFGAGVNAWYLLSGSDYSNFADTSPLAFVRETWHAVVGPNQGLWIGLLIVFEASAGILVLAGGRARRVGLVALMAFHLGLLPLAWFYWVWSLPMLAALALLWRADRRWAGERRPPEADVPALRSAHESGGAH